MFYTMFGKCKNANSCKFIHKSPEPSQDANNKHKHKQINDVLKERIINLEASVKTLLHNDMIRQQDEENETTNDSLTIQNGIDISDQKQDESSVMENEPPYNIYADLEYKNILNQLENLEAAKTA